MTLTIRKLGWWFSLAGVILALVYLAALGAALAAGVMPPIEPFQSIISVVSLVSAPLFVCLWAVLHQAVPEEKKVFTRTSLTLVSIFATLTSINRYVALTVVRQSQSLGITSGLEWFMPYGWPSVMAAVEVLAWGFFLGLAFLTLVPVFGKGKLERSLFWTLVLSGIFCLIGTFGQVVNSVLFNLMGILGWGIGLTTVLALLAAWFRRQPVV